jgi:hypothetical protein
VQINALGNVFLFFFLEVLWFELKTSCLLGRHSTAWATLPALFCVGYFWDRVSGTICLRWLQTTILLICASWVVMIIGMSHYLVEMLLFVLVVLGFKCRALWLLSRCSTTWATPPAPEMVFQLLIIDCWPALQNFSIWSLCFSDYVLYSRESWRPLYTKYFLLPELPLTYKR